MTFRVQTRADDEVLLQMLALRRNRTAAEIGKLFGKSPEAVRVVTNDVIKADSLAEGQDMRRYYRYMDFSLAVRVGMTS